jgi:hypothetical protein
VKISAGSFRRFVFPSPENQIRKSNLVACGFGTSEDALPYQPAVSPAADIAREQNATVSIATAKVKK